MTIKVLVDNRTIRTAAKVFQRNKTYSIGDAYLTLRAGSIDVEQKAPIGSELYEELHAMMVCAGVHSFRMNDEIFVRRKLQQETTFAANRIGKTLAVTAAASVALLMLRKAIG